MRKKELQKRSQDAQKTEFFQTAAAFFLAFSVLAGVLVARMITLCSSAAWFQRRFVCLLLPERCPA